MCSMPPRILQPYYFDREVHPMPGEHVCTCLWLLGVPSLPLLPHELARRHARRRLLRRISDLVFAR